MGSLSNPKTWVPYWNNKDCSQGFCSFYCPQWCYIVYPPPPPLDFPDDGGGGGPSSSFSPLVVAIIGILASAFLLVSYYTIISKYCGRGNADQGRRSVGENPVGDEFNAENRSDPSFQEPWHVATAGLDEAAIKAIAVCRYRRGEGLVEGTDCSVCLSEFQEDESVRLLPKCGHAFHIQCIDTWLRSHSNCPLCRANVICVGPQDAATDQSPFADGSTAGIEVVVVGQNSSSGVDREVENNVANVVPPKNANASSLRAFSDLGYLEERHAVIEVRDEIRRSVSMDFSRPNRVLVADILRTNSGAEEEEEDGQDDYVDVEECSLQRASCSKFVNWKYNNINGRRKGILHCVMSPVAMKRSVSSGRFFLSRNTIIPP